MTVDKNLKKSVINDWQLAFSQLIQFSPDKLYRIVGPTILGLELIKLPRTEDYRPHFVIYSLWGNRFGNDITASLSGPIMIKEFKDNKGFQYSIPYEQCFGPLNNQTKLQIKNCNLSLWKDANSAGRRSSESSKKPVKTA